MSSRFAVIDFETTGFSPKNGDRIIQVAVVIIESDKQVDEYHSLVKTGRHIPYDIEIKTGIKNEMLKDAPPASTVLPDLHRFIGNANLVAHNASFDSRFLHSELSNIGIMTNRDFICTLLLSRRLYQKSSNCKLQTLAQYHGIQYKGSRHSALADALVTAELFLIICGHLKSHLAISDLTTEAIIRAQKEHKRTFSNTAKKIHTEKKQKKITISNIKSPPDVMPTSNSKQPVDTESKPNPSESQTCYKDTKDETVPLGNASVLTAQRQEEVRKQEALKTITFWKFLYAAKSLSYEKIVGSVLCVVLLLCIVFVFTIEPPPLSPARDPSADSGESVQVPDELSAEVSIGDEELRENMLGKAAADKAAAAARALTKNLGMEFVNIKTRRFSMGSPASEVHQDPDEFQVTVSILNDFELGTTEVTQGQFKKVMGTEPWLNQDSVQIGEDNAASYVDWNDATAFCQKLTALERKAGKLQAGKAYRLPTEAEWEYACRAGTTKAFSFGNDEKQLGNYVWFDGNAKNVGHGYAHKVRMKKPNPEGLFDMHGNVWEWCSDWYYKELSGGTDPVGPRRGSDRVLRGGSWGSAPGNCRSAARDYDDPSNRSSRLGFRVARSQSSQ